MSVDNISNKQKYIDCNALANIDILEAEEKEGGGNVVTFDDQSINKRVCISSRII
jgi:hypothetical protein